MDSQKVAFITCVNDEDEYRECRYYLDRLCVPEGYIVDTIDVREAPSMTAGYNAGMRSSDAKYKVYLHQDVFIKNVNFINDLLTVFSQGEQIGMVGMIGKRHLKADNAEQIMVWDTGRVIDNQYIWCFNEPSEGVFAEVQAADGLLLATQYDIPWREDIFTGWDFYDISQCMEFRKAGLKVVVPWQREEWCYHDMLYSKFTQYFDQYIIFIQEYATMLDGIDTMEIDRQCYAKEQDCAQAIEQLRAGVAELFTMGDKKSLRTLLVDADLRKSIYLREYTAIVQIDRLEEEACSVQRLWKEGMSAAQLTAKLRRLKYWLKRIEYAEDVSKKEQVQEEYSRYAILDVCSRYVVDKDKVLGAIADIL